MQQSLSFEVIQKRIVLLLADQDKELHGRIYKIAEVSEPSQR